MSEQNADIADDAEALSGKISYAKIKYLEGARRGTFEVVSVDRLNKNFSSSSFDKAIKYKLDGEEKVQLLHLSGN